MRYSELFGKTIKQAPKDEVSQSAKLLIRGGFIRKEVAGVYNFLPLGLRTLEKITNIVREEMNKAGGQEVLLPALQNKKNWQKTGRWDSFDALYKVGEDDFALGPTHEEVIVPLAKQFISSYRDLPLALYQIQTKFRDEPRAKSGILRGREFLMKDLYSFHTDEEDFSQYYEQMKGVYQKVFERCRLDALETEAGGGTFSEFSHEYQILAEGGEDTIFYCPNRDWAQNLEISKLKPKDKCPKCGAEIEEGKAIEVGNIFPLKTRFSEVFDLTFKDKSGTDKLVIMGCYGIGISRLMGTIVEVHHDERGIIWPEEVCPFRAHLIDIPNRDLVTAEAQKVYETLKGAGVEVLWDDREEVGAGEKFADADLIGCPVRLVVSEKTGNKIEYKERDKKETELLPLEAIIKKLAG